MNIGEYIHKRRIELNLTLEQVGNATGVSKSTVKKWESGFISNMGRDKISSLSKILKVNPESLICDDFTDEDVLNMGNRIKKLRTDSNMTQEELGNILGVQKSAIRKYEKGSVVNLKHSTIKKLSELFNVSTEYLLGIEEDDCDIEICIPADNKDVEEVLNYDIEVLSKMKNRPEMRMLFNVSKDCTIEEIKQTIQIIEVLKNNRLMTDKKGVIK